MGLPKWLSGKESTCQCWRCRRCGFNPWIRKSPWRRKWHPTLVFPPGESHGQKSLVSYSPQCCRVRHGWATEHRCTHIHHNFFLIKASCWDLFSTTFSRINFSEKTKDFLRYNFCSCTIFPFILASRHIKQDQ